MTVRVCVGALLLRRDATAKVLLGKRSPDRAYYPSVWDMPGGHCEEGEEAKQALIRELREELGVTPTEARLVAEIRDSASNETDRLHLYVYAVTEWTGAPANLLREEHSEVAWFDLDTAARLDLAHPSYPGLFARLSSLL